VKGEGNQQDYGMRIYDPRVGRFLSVDPLTKSYPYYTPYSFAGNKPIAFIDRDGEEEGFDRWLTHQQKAVLTHQISEDQYRENVRAMGMGAVVGGVVLTDIFLTKGWLSRTLIMSQGFGLIEHNRAKTPEGRAAQDARFKENVTDFSINLLSGYVLGSSFKGLMAMANNARKLYNFGGKALGEMGEEALARLYRTTKPSGRGSSMNTSLGPRKPDGIPAGSSIATTDKLYEAKVGFQQYSGNIVDQVAKDAELLASGQVNEITWVFFRSPNTGKVGAADNLLIELRKAGIKTEIAGDIPKDIVEKAVIKYAPTPRE
jgi:hypothetical protein